MKEQMISENLKAHFLRLYQMAFSDDDFSPLELKMLYKFAQERHISKEELDKLLLNPTHSQTTIPHSIEEKVEYLHDLCCMIWADGIVDQNERTTLEKYIKLFGFLEENAKELADYLLEATHKGQTKEAILFELKS